MYQRLCKLVLEQVEKELDLFIIERNALAGLGAVGRPVANIVLGLGIVPGNDVELLLPAARGLGNNTDLFNDIDSDLCHYNDPP